MNEQQMRDGLRSAASGAGTPALTLDDVRGRARGIRRRRAVTGAAGAAALVAAAVVPIALLTGGGSSPDTLPPADATPTAVDTANPVAGAHPPGWIVDGEVRASDGTAFAPDVDGSIAYLLRLGPDRWVLGVEPGGDGLQVLVVDASGSVVSSHEALDGGLAGDAVGGAAVWVGTDGHPRSVVAGSDEVLRWAEPLESDRLPPMPGWVLPGCDLGSCSMLAEVSRNPVVGTTLASVTSDGALAAADVPGLLRVFDVSPDGSLASGYTSVDDERAEACSAVVTVETGELLWETCEASSLRFSPDGRRVLATDAYLDGFGQSLVEVRSATTGEVEQEYEGGTVFDFRWTTEESFLVSVQTEEGRHQLLRVGTDPAAVEVVEQVEGLPGDPAGMVRLGR